MVLNREDLRNQLKRREIAPVYLLFGPETYLRDVAAKTIGDFSFAEGDLRLKAVNLPGPILADLALEVVLPSQCSHRSNLSVRPVRAKAADHRDYGC